MLLLLYYRVNNDDSELPVCVFIGGWTLSLLNICSTVYEAYIFLDSLAFLLEPKHPQGSLRFLVLGDWGGLPFHPYTTPVQTSVADQMEAVAARENASFVVSVGDNFYLHGVKNAEDPRFQLTFESVYKGSLLHIPWYVIAGNHDHYGNVSAQIEYTKRSTRWKFPHFYHKQTKMIPGGKTMDIFLLDTIQLCGNVYSMAQPVGPTDTLVAENQWAWLQQGLNNSQAEYIVVVGHYPVRSVAEHGSTDCLIRRLEPLLVRYNVTTYLAGHDHNLQHIQTIQNDTKMNYYVIGAGNFVDDSQAHITSVPAGSLKFHMADLMYLGGFAYCEVTDSTMTLKIIDGTGVVRYSHEMKPRA